MYLTTDQVRIDKQIKDGFAETLANGVQGNTVDRLMATVQPHLDELRAVRDSKHEEHGRLVRASQATHDELDRAKQEIARLRFEFETRED